MVAVVAVAAAVATERVAAEVVAVATETVAAAVVAVATEIVAAAEGQSLILLARPLEAQVIRALALVARSDSYCTSGYWVGLRAAHRNPVRNALNSTQYNTKRTHHENLLHRHNPAVFF